LNRGSVSVRSIVVALMHPSISDLRTKTAARVPQGAASALSVATMLFALAAFAAALAGAVQQSLSSSLTAVH